MPNYNELLKEKAMKLFQELLELQSNADIIERIEYLEEELEKYTEDEEEPVEQGISSGRALELRIKQGLLCSNYIPPINPYETSEPTTQEVQVGQIWLSSANYWQVTEVQLNGPVKGVSLYDCNGIIPEGLIGVDQSTEDWINSGQLMYDPSEEFSLEELMSKSFYLLSYPSSTFRCIGRDVDGSLSMIGINNDKQISVTPSSLDSYFKEIEKDEPKAAESLFLQMGTEIANAISEGIYGKMYPSPCNHNWTSYQGLVESYEYCKDCGEKKKPKKGRTRHLKGDE